MSPSDAGVDEASPEATRGDERPAVDVLDASSRHRLVQLAYRLVWNQADAEDAVHNAVAVAHAKRNQLRSPAKWWSWMCRIVVRQCLLERRSRQRWRKHASDLVHDVRNARDSDSDAIERHETASLVRRALDTLPPQQRLAVTLRHLEQMPYEKVAEIMELSPATVRAHVRLARESMQQFVTRESPHETGLSNQKTEPTS